MVLLIGHACLKLKMKMHIISKKGFDFQIGILVSEMEYVRNETYRLLKTQKLATSELDFNFDAYSNSIGTLLLHIACHEFKFQLNNFYKRNITEDEFKLYRHAMPSTMNKRGIYGNDLDFYLKELESVRENTLSYLKNLKDEWLFEEIILSNGKNIGNYYYHIRHIIDDEINHQGQMKITLKRLSFL
ncbi:integrase [Dokdonia pacifica]|uniref:DinB superfamily protein n=2 Tax=Dokdonia pacifica TaxID=1627892 RepID=A0A239DBA7_9FLAO|nr:integrase [Dokdonia pacifica]SNS29686.1 DinB superfamily protein [Dokdonia pacifica]